MEHFLETMSVNAVMEPKDVSCSRIVEAETLLPPKVFQETLADSADDCVICYQTLYRPARTECGHVACESCLFHWVLMAMELSPETQQLAANLAIAGIKFKCPTCRTYTQAAFDAAHDTELQSRYPEEYAARAKESGSSLLQPEDEEGIQTMVLIFGNSYRKVAPSISPHTGKTRTHEWTFFVQSSRQDVVEKVFIVLHPSFRGDRLVTLKQPPFSTTQLGWGYFTIFAGIQLAPGYQWVNQDRAVDSDAAKGQKNDLLPVEWLLEFRGTGSQRNRVVKFKKLQAKVDVALEDDSDLDSGPLAVLMSETELMEYKEMRRLSRAAIQVGEQ